MVLQRLNDVNLKFNPNKCMFFAKNIRFLGHVVRKAGTGLDLDKVKVVMEFLVPKMVTNIWTFLALTTYYKNYIWGYAKIATLSFELTKHDITFQWTLNYQEAFDQLKHALVSTPVLARQDFCKAFILNVESFVKGVGIILFQKDRK